MSFFMGLIMLLCALSNNIHIIIVVKNIFT